MNNQNDPIDRALQSLRNEKWPGEGHNPELETKLMQEFDKRNSGSKIRRHPLIAASLAILVLGSFGFAAAGGVEIVKSWFMTIEVNGEVIAAQEIVVDENGNAEFDLPPIELEEGEAAIATITMDGAEAVGDGEMRNITVTLGEDGGHVVVEKGELPEDEE